MYEQQLATVRLALGQDAQNEDLSKLVEDLSQLITLTSQNLLEEKKAKLLAELDQQANPENDDTKEEDIEDKEDTEEESQIDLTQLEGMKCQAPHRSRASGAVSMSNAMISNCENSAEDSLENGTDSVLVRVLFTHPTSSDMVPCSFYLAGKCKFADDSCRSSHGEIVKLSELKEFQVFF